MSIEDGVHSVSTESTLTPPAPPQPLQPLQPQYAQVQPQYAAQAATTPLQPQYAAQPLAPTQPQTIAPAQQPAPSEHHESTMRSSRTRFEPDALICAGVGIVLAVTGLIAMIRAGFDGPMSLPVVSILGFTHTATLGIIELLFGLALLLSGAARSRNAETLFGLLLAVGGFIGAVQNQSFTTSLALESAMAWIVMLLGVVVVLSALVMPRYAMRSASVHQS